MEDNSWRNNFQFRQQLRNKLEESFKAYPAGGVRDVIQLETTIFTSSKTKDDYVKNAFKVLQCVKDKSRQQQNQPPNQQPNQPQAQINSSTQDPMSALQNLASFPASDSQTTLIKTIPINNNAMNDQGNMIGVTVTPANISLAGGHGSNQIQVTAQPMQQISQMQMQQINANQANIQMGNSQPQQIQMTTISTGGPQMVHHHQQQPQQQQQQQQQQQHLPPQHRIGLQQNRMQIGQMMIQQGQMPGRPTMMQMQRVRHAPNMTIQAQMQPPIDTQFYQQVQHRPIQQQQQPPQSQQQQQQQQQQPPQQQPQIQHFQQSPQMSQGNMMVDQGSIPQQMHPMHQGPPSNQMHVTMTPTQSQFVPSPSQGIIPSPMSVGMMQRGPGSIPSIPSPGQLNTPQMVQQTSPAHRQMTNDDQAYQEKLKQLQRFIGPLRARLDREENDKKKDPIKIRNLLAIISDSASRVPMEVLAKCELLLEKMDFQQMPSGQQQQPQQQHQPQRFIGQQGGSQMVSDQNIGQPLIDALLNNIKKPFFNHSLHRTFSRAVCSLSNGTQRPPIPNPTRVPYIVDEDIPHTIQGEVARLESKFKVQLHPNHYPGSKKINLICRLDDEDLPCVPPISLMVPDDYPNEPPLVSIDDEEYNAAPFLMDIKQTFTNAISNLNSIYSMTTLLDYWAMSVRQACNNQHHSKPEAA